MATPTEYFRFWINDELTGKRRLTTYKLTRAEAEKRHPGAVPYEQTREVRNLPSGPDDWLINTKPGS